MNYPIGIVFRNFDPPEGTAERIRKAASDLPQLPERVLTCDVVLETPRPHHHGPRQYRVHAEVVRYDGMRTRSEPVTVNDLEAELADGVRRSFADLAERFKREQAAATMQAR